MDISTDFDTEVWMRFVRGVVARVWRASRKGDGFASTLGLEVGGLPVETAVHGYGD